MSDAPITVYWRPGCGFCRSLLGGLQRSGLEFERVDIWHNEHGAASVRSVAGDNETVSTARVGGIALINPSASDVLRTVQAELPGHLPSGYVLPRPGLVARGLRARVGGQP